MGFMAEIMNLKTSARTRANHEVAYVHRYRLDC